MSLNPEVDVSGKWTTKKDGITTQLVSGRNNVFLMQSGQISLLVDAGMAYMYENLVQKLHKISAKPSIIALTHSHYDHAENAARLKKLFNAKLLIHKSEASHLSAGINPEDDPFSGAASADEEHYSPVKPDITAQGGECFEGVEIMHTPGHTPGSISIILDGEIAAVGDSMFSVYPGQAMTPYVMDRKQLLKSWEKLFAKGCRLFLPAHGRPVTRETAEAEYKKWGGR